MTSVQKIKLTSRALMEAVSSCVQECGRISLIHHLLALFINATAR